MSLHPDRQNLTIWKGATFEHRFTWFQGGEDSSPRDLTGYTGQMSIRSSNGTELLSLTTENGGIAVGGAGGTIDLTIPAATTSSLPWKTAVYDLIVTSGLGTAYMLVFGGIAVKGV